MYGFSPDNMRLNPQTERCVFDEKGPDNKTEIRRWSEPWVAEEGMKELGSQLRDGVVSFLFLCSLFCVKVGLVEPGAAVSRRVGFNCLEWSSVFMELSGRKLAVSLRSGSGTATFGEDSA